MRRHGENSAREKVGDVKYSGATRVDDTVDKCSDKYSSESVLRALTKFFASETLSIRKTKARRLHAAVIIRPTLAYGWMTTTDQTERKHRVWREICGGPVFDETNWGGGGTTEAVRCVGTSDKLR